MTGTVDDASLDAAKTRRASDQTSLYDYDDDTEETFVGIVHSPNEEMTEVCDEIDHRLAPDKELFQHWISTRDTFKEDMDYVEAHNRAFDSVNYRKRFLQGLDFDVIDEHAERILDGENIVYVCYCGNGCQCHRRIVKEHVHNQVRLDG